jgi:hypothetical protein
MGKEEQSDSHSIINDWGGPRQFPDCLKLCLRGNISKNSFLGLLKGSGPSSVSASS